MTELKVHKYADRYSVPLGGDLSRMALPRSSHDPTACQQLSEEVGWRVRGYRWQLERLMHAQETCRQPSKAEAFQNIYECQTTNFPRMTLAHRRLPFTNGLIDD